MHLHHLQLLSGTIFVLSTLFPPTVTFHLPSTNLVNARAEPSQDESYETLTGDWNLTGPVTGSSGVINSTTSLQTGPPRNFFLQVSPLSESIIPRLRVWLLVVYALSCQAQKVWTAKVHSVYYIEQSATPAVSIFLGSSMPPGGYDVKTTFWTIGNLFISRPETITFYEEQFRTYLAGRVLGTGTMRLASSNPAIPLSACSNKISNVKGDVQSASTVADVGDAGGDSNDIEIFRSSVGTDVDIVGWEWSTARAIRAQYVLAAIIVALEKLAVVPTGSMIVNGGVTVQEPLEEFSLVITNVVDPFPGLLTNGKAANAMYALAKLVISNIDAVCVPAGGEIWFDGRKLGLIVMVDATGSHLSTNGSPRNITIPEVRLGASSVTVS